MMGKLKEITLGIVFALCPFRILTPLNDVPSWLCEFEVVGDGMVSIGGFVFCYRNKGVVYAKLIYGNSILKIDGVVGSFYPKFTVY